MNAPRSMFLNATPDCMKGPWESSKSELRMYDHPAKNIDEFNGYMQRHTGPTGRFLDPGIKDSAKVRVTHRRLRDIYRALLNYDRHNQGEPGFRSYKEMNLAGDTRNCQTFAADFFRYLTGKPSTPYAKLIRKL